MDAQFGRYLASIGWSLPALAALYYVFRGTKVFRYRMIGFLFPLMFVAVSYWWLALSAPWGIDERIIQPWFQTAQAIAGPVTLLQILITARHYQQNNVMETALRDEIRNGNGS